MKSGTALTHQEHDQSTVLKQHCKELVMYTKINADGSVALEKEVVTLLDLNNAAFVHRLNFPPTKGGIGTLKFRRPYENEEPGDPTNQNELPVAFVEGELHFKLPQEWMLIANSAWEGDIRIERI